jgi:hypothetical protein
MGGTRGTYGGDEKCRRFLWGNVKGWGQLGQPRHRWEDNIKMDMKETGWEGMDWIHLV